MCGRFTLRTPPAQWCQLFLPQVSANQYDPDAVLADWQPRYNIAPTTPILAVVQRGNSRHRQLASFRWGLVPFWAEDTAIGNRMINARSETVDEKKSFRSAFAKRRCLIVADGYFEWKKQADGKQPFLIESTQQATLAMAGLWETNQKVSSQPLESCTILTTASNETTRTVHDRMPVFLDTADHDEWLDPVNDNVDQLKQLLRPAADTLLRITPVSRFVNNVRNQGPECVAAAR